MTYKSKDYLNAAVAGASPVGLVVLLYERMIADLRRAVAAMEKGEVEVRVQEINHAFLILGQLEGSLDSSRAPESAKTQTLFYQVVRNKILEAHLKGERKLLEEQIALLNDVRAAWEQVDPARHQPQLPKLVPRATVEQEEQNLSVLDASA